MKISKHLAIAMENADTSGLSEADLDAIKDFPDFTVIDYPESNDINGRCALTGLWDTVVEIEIKGKQ